MGTVDEHKVIQQIQQFETDTHSNMDVPHQYSPVKRTNNSPIKPPNQSNHLTMDQLGEMISCLEERTNCIKSRKLQLTQESTRQNKRQDLRQSPTKRNIQTS